MNSKKNINKY